MREVELLERRTYCGETILVEFKRGFCALVAQVKLFKLSADGEALQSRNSVVFQVEFLEVEALPEAVHARYAIVKEIDLDKAFKTAESGFTKLTQVVLLQVQDCQVGAVLAQERLCLAVAVDLGHGAQPALTHLEVRHLLQKESVSHHGPLKLSPQKLVAGKCPSSLR